MISLISALVEFGWWLLCIFVFGSFILIAIFTGFIKDIGLIFLLAIAYFTVEFMIKNKFGKKLS